MSLQCKGLSRAFSNSTVQCINSSVLSFLYDPTLTSIHDHWKKLSFDEMDFVGKVMSLLLNMLSRLVITFLPRSKRLLISWPLPARPGPWRVPRLGLLLWPCTAPHVLPRVQACQLIKNFFNPNVFVFSLPLRKAISILSENHPLLF